MQWVRWFAEVGIDDVGSVGGKNASLGEMIRELAPHGIRIPDGFAVTAEGYRHFLSESGLESYIAEELEGIDRNQVETLVEASGRIRERMVAAAMPEDLVAELGEAYRRLSKNYHVKQADVAVRSSATAEDLPEASFAGQQETFLNVRGEGHLIESVKAAFASLFTPRAIHYRENLGFGHFDVALSVGVQKMVRADKGSSGVIFTLDTESGHPGIIMVTSAWGLGENVVQGRVVPDMYYVHKDTLDQGFSPIVLRRCGSKEMRMVYDEQGHRLTKNVPVAEADRARYSLGDEDVLTLARWSLAIEKHYSKRRGHPVPMDIEWGRDGVTGEVFILQARPETVHSRRTAPRIREYHLKASGEVLVTGAAVGESIATGKARVISDPSGMGRFQAGEVLITETTDPDWEPIMKTAAAIVTAGGGRTSHAAIVSRELGIPAIVGAEKAMTAVSEGETVTVSCAEGATGFVYRGEIPFDVEEIDTSTVERPETAIMMNVGDPERALHLSKFPCDGVGLARMEFIFAGWVRVHPLALTRFESLDSATRREVEALTRGYDKKEEYFVDRLSQGIGLLAAAFYPRPVILRFSDFKTNEYAGLLGGKPFEPHEENPMLGWRGASRYYDAEYKEGFLLEVAAVRRVREHFGLRNLKVMIPFCRTPEEGRRVLEVMREGGLVRGENELEVYVMAEIPSNILLAEQFAKLFDGFSIGSNDLTQLTLGVDRDSARVAGVFDERNQAVKDSCAMLIERAHRAGRKVGICGQAPSDYPEFAAFLVERGIDSLSLNPDAVVPTMRRVHALEQKLSARSAEEAREEREAEREIPFNPPP